MENYKKNCNYSVVTVPRGVWACMSRDFDLFMSKHLAGQWLLNSYEKFTEDSGQEKNGGNHPLHSEKDKRTNEENWNF